MEIEICNLGLEEMKCEHCEYDNVTYCAKLGNTAKGRNKFMNVILSEDEEEVCCDWRCSDTFRNSSNCLGCVEGGTKVSCKVNK